MTVRQWLFPALFAVAFAYVESTIVVYLRALYFPDGFCFPLKFLSGQHLAVEIGREAATLVMMAAVSLICMGGKRTFLRFSACFAFVFGVWDIFYYVWLKALLGWPASLLTWDVLFLIPVVWAGPVLSPILVALAMVAAGLRWGRLDPAQAAGYPGRRDVLALAFACVLILYTYMDKTAEFLGDLQNIQEGLPPAFVPEEYNWPIFLAAYILGLAVIVRPVRAPVAEPEAPAQSNNDGPP